VALRCTFKVKDKQNGEIRQCLNTYIKNGMPDCGQHSDDQGMALAFSFDKSGKDLLDAEPFTFNIEELMISDPYSEPSRDDQKIERLTNLTLALVESRQPISMNTLTQDIPGYPPSGEARRIAFERDKKLLREEGINVEAVQIEGEEQFGYQISQESSELLPKLGKDKLSKTQKRFRNRLEMLKWLSAAGSSPVEDVAKRFDMSKEEAIKELEAMAICGKPPFEPSDLLYISIDEESVIAHIPDISIIGRFIPSEDDAIPLSARSPLA